MDFKFSDVDSINFNEDGKKLFVVDVPHEYIANKDYSKIASTLKDFERVGAHKFRNSVYMTFGGYDDHPDELYEIKEARDYIEGMVHRFPQVLYYMTYDIDSSAHILACLGDVETFYTGERKPLTEYPLSALAYGQLPRKDALLTISKKLFKSIENSLYNYGKKVGDIQGANKAVKILNKLYNFQ